MWATCSCGTLTDNRSVPKVKHSAGAQSVEEVDVSARLHTVRYTLYTGCECHDNSHVH